MMRSRRASLSTGLVELSREDLDFEAVWRFLDIYRKQSGWFQWEHRSGMGGGLTISAVEEAKQTFRQPPGTGVACVVH